VSTLYRKMQRYRLDVPGEVMPMSQARLA